jgi:hypothetical protein
MNISLDFIEKLVLLLITAGLTGFGLPILLRQRDDRKLREQKKFEAELARQSKIIEAQVELLESLAELLWEFQLSIIAVSYYRGMKHRDLYTPALKDYEEKAGELIGKIRAEISKSLRLTTCETYLELKKLYYDQILPLDQRLFALVAKGDDPKVNREWYEFNRFAVYELSELVDNVIDRLASELRLKEKDLNGNVGSDDV